MDQLITNQFRAALIHLLAREGRGAQTRLAKQQNIDRGYLNAIVKGRKPGSETIRSKIADHFDMAYEDMFILGRRVLERTENSAATYDHQTFEVLTTEEPTLSSTPEYIAEDLKVPMEGEVGSSSIQARISKAIELLESDTKYGDLLVGLIDVFHNSLNANRENKTLKKQMKELESRVQRLEENVDSEKERIKKSV